MESASAKPYSGVSALASTLGIVAGPGAGKTLLVKHFITRTLAAGLPVRILETFNTGEYRHFVQALGGLMFDRPAGDDFFAAWRSKAPLVCVTCDDRQVAEALNFGLLDTPHNALFVCDEARFYGNNFRLMGQMCILVSQLADTFPVPPEALLVNDNGSWALRLAKERDMANFCDLLFRGLASAH